MKAIIVKYYGPTNTRGSRFVASADGVKSISVSYNHALPSAGNANEVVAARRLALTYGWTGSYYAGTLPDGRVAFVNAGTHGAPLPGEVFSVLRGDIDMARGMGEV